MGQPLPGWDGIVRCEVLAVDEPTLLQYDWTNKEGDEPSVVINRLEEIPGGTRLTWDHTGFRTATTKADVDRSVDQQHELSAHVPGLAHAVGFGHIG